jgi:UDP-N-acetylglucosamine 4,6-dehydratase
MFNNKNVLITGGTGSFGKNLSSYLLKKYKKIKRLVIFSRY